MSASGLQYGVIFDPRKMVIDILANAGGTSLERKRESAGKLNPLCRGLDPLYIDDPLNPDNNVGQSVFRIYQVQRAFEAAKNFLEGHSIRVAANAAATENNHPTNLLVKLLQSVKRADN